MSGWAGAFAVFLGGKVVGNKEKSVCNRKMIRFFVVLDVFVREREVFFPIEERGLMFDGALFRWSDFLGLFWMLFSALSFNIKAYVSCFSLPNLRTLKKKLVTNHTQVPQRNFKAHSISASFKAPITTSLLNGLHFFDSKSPHQPFCRPAG